MYQHVAEASQEALGMWDAEVINMLALIRLAALLDNQVQKHIVRDVCLWRLEVAVESHVLDVVADILRATRVVEANLIHESAQELLPQEADAVARRAVPLAFGPTAGRNT